MSNLMLDMGSKESLATPKIEITDVNVDVLQHPENIFTLADELVANYVALLESRGGTFDVTSEEMFKYFITTFVERVRYVRNERNSYKSFVQYSAHPHILGVLIANVGKAYDDQTGLSLTPAINLEMEFNSKKLKEYILDESAYLTITKKFMMLRTFGVSVGDELPSDKKGDFLTLSFACIEGNIKREDTRAHPTQALVALISGIHLAESAITPRVTYISKDRVSTLIRAAAEFELPKNRHV